MNKQGNNFLIALLVGAGFALAVILLNWNSGKETVRIFCDAFTLAAVMLLGFAGLVWSRNEGTFDMLNYGVSRSFKYRYKKRDEKYKESFYDYKKRKREDRTPAWGSLWAGLVYLAIALILMLVFYIF